MNGVRKCEICKAHISNSPMIIEVGERGDAKTGRIICDKCFKWAYKMAKRKRNGRKRAKIS